MDCSVLSAVQSGNVEVLNAFLGEGKDYNIKYDKEWCLVHHAAYNGHFKCVELILKRATSDYKFPTEIVENVLTLTTDQETPLSLSAMKGHSNVVEFLADLYSNVEVNYENIGFPLHAACKHGHNECIEILLKKMPLCNNARDGGDWGQYPIHITVEIENLEGTKILLKNGCDVNRICNRIPVHIAVKRKKYEIFKHLSDKISDITVWDLDSYTPLFLASLNGNAQTVRYLLDNGADATILSSYWDKSCFPIDIAVVRGHLEVVKLLVNYTPTDCGSSSVIQAAIYGKNDCLKLLFEKGFPTFDSNEWIKIINHFQSLKNVYTETVKILLDNETLFGHLAKLHENKNVWYSGSFNIYFLPDIFIHVNSEVLTQFLDAGILELQFNCKLFPDAKCIIEKHKEFQREMHIGRVVSGILICLKYFPFLTWSHENDSVLPTIKNFIEGDLVQTVPSLLNLTRWTIRCIILRSKGMIHQKYVKNMKLPKKITEFLVKC